MKKTFKAVLTFSFVLYAVSCSELELKKSENFENSTTEGGTTTTMFCCAPDWPALQTRLTEVSRHNFVNYGEFLGTITFDGNPPQYAYLNPWKEALYNIENLPDDLDVDTNELAADIAAGIEPNPYFPGSKSYHAMLDDDFSEFGSLLSWYQKDALNDYFTAMESITSAAGATQEYNNAINQINSTLVDPQRRDTRIMVEMAHRSALEYFSHHQDVFTHLENETLRAGGGCSINWRDVWRDAVWGGLKGAAAGAIAGALGGTVVLPGIGTLTGAVGVGIFGLFAGYAAGAADSIASQWFWNCLMQSPQSDPGADCENFEFSINNQEYCNIDVFTPSLLWYLTGNE